MTESLPDISSMKLSELKQELNLYGIDSSGFCEKQDFTSALDNARKTLPRPTTTYHEVEKPEPEKPPEKPPEKSRSSKSSSRSSRHSSKSSSSSAQSYTPPAPAPAPTPPPAAAPPAAAANNATNMKKLMASRNPVTALQQIKEHPSERLLGERSNSFLAGSPFSFSLKGTIHESDAAIFRVPDGVCLTISSASVERKPLEEFLKQKGSIGISLKVASEENPSLLPIWTFDKDKSKSYGVTDLGIECRGPRTIRMLAWMEMGFRSAASIDLHVFGSVKLDMDKF